MTPSRSYMAVSIRFQQLLSSTAMDDLHLLLTLAWHRKMNTSKRFRVFSAQSKTTLLCAACIACLPFLSPAQQNKLTVSTPEQIVVKRGGSTAGTLNVAVLPGFHVNSDKPKDEFLIPLKLTWTAGPLQAQSVTYPKPEEVKVGNDMLSVFTGSFNIQTAFKAPASATPGPATVLGKLRYQACNNQMCFRPATIEIRVPVLIE